MALSVLAGVACGQAPVKVTLGIYSFKKPTEVYKQFQPVAEALAKQVGGDASVELQVMKSYEDCFAAFLAGKVDVVRFGPASYVLAKQRDKAIELLAAEREDSHQVGLIVVRDDSPLRKLEDLRGKRFAFGDQQSTIGRYLSQAELVLAGIKASTLQSFQFLDRHDIVFKAVELGDFDAGALHVETFVELNAKAEQKLRVLHAFDNAPKPWIARAGLDPAVVARLRAALLKLDDPVALKALKVPGFAPVADGDFDTVRKGMALSEQFAPTPPVENQPQPSPPQPSPAGPPKGP